MFFEPFILVGSLFFYVLLTIFVVIMLALVEYDNGWASVWTVAIFALVVSQVTTFPLFTWLMANPFGALELAAYYFMLGAVWGIVKWYFYCLKLSGVAKDAKMLFLNKEGVTGNDIPKDKRKKFISELTRYDSAYTDNHFPPQAMAHKSDWLMWATYWPFSFFWTMLNQPIKYIWEFIYSHLGSVMQNISDKVFKGI